MTNILDQVARSSAQSRYGHFRPATAHEFLALRLAHHLGEGSIARKHPVNAICERENDVGGRNGTSCIED
jgi:hypothetical protein